MGLDFLGKHPDCQKQKKVFLAFLIFSFTHFDDDKFNCHQTPRHFAAGVVSIVSPAICEFSNEEFRKSLQLRVLKD